MSSHSSEHKITEQLKWCMCAVPFVYVSLQVLADKQRAARSHSDEQRVARSCPLETGTSLHLGTMASRLN